MYTITIGSRINGTVRTLPGAHMIAKMHSDNDARGEYVRVYATSDVNRTHVLGEYLNGLALIRLDD